MAIPGQQTQSVPTFLAALYKCASGTCGLRNIAQFGGPGNAAHEGGIDLPSTAGTPVYALGAGEIVGSGYWGPGQYNLSTDSSGCSYCHGVVTIRTNVPGFGLQDVYYQHITIDKSVPLIPNGTTKGPSIAKGALLGVINANPGEVEVGFNATGWGTIWGPDPHPAAWSNTPDVLIRAMVNSDPTFQWGSQTSGAASGAAALAGAAIQKAAIVIGPNDSVAQLLTDIDTALQITNPFNVPINTDITISAPIIGQIDTGIPNPGAFGGYAMQVFENLGYDFSALMVRGIFIVIGLMIIAGLAMGIQQQVANAALAPVGGVQGAVKIAGAFL